MQKIEDLKEEITKKIKIIKQYEAKYQWLMKMVNQK
jgi:hypothetical protein